jgi:hypothetical protein
MSVGVYLDAGDKLPKLRTNIYKGEEELHSYPSLWSVGPINPTKYL